MQVRKWRARFDRQLIEREMLGGFRDGAGELGTPSLRSLAGPGVDQIEGIALERRARDRNRLERLLRRVQAPERCERGVIERLHAERDAVDAGRAIAAKPGRFHAGRIGFERDFGSWRDGPMLADRLAK